MKKFPKEIVVVWNEDDDNDFPFLMAFEDVNYVAIVGEKVKAAIYELKVETTVTTEVKAS